MGRAVRKWVRRFQLMTTVMAVMGLVLNVFCNPFSPTQILQWVDTLDPAQSHSIRLPCRDSSGWVDPDSASNGSLLGVSDSDQSDERSDLDLPPDIDDTIAIRPRPRLSAPSRLDISIGWLLASPTNVAVRHRADAPFRHFTDLRCISPQFYPLIC